jgi:hypothetical protein
MGLALVVVALMFSLVGQSVAATPRAALRLVDDTTPPTLRGVGFQPREHVRVVVVAGSTRSVTSVMATARGRFTIRVHGDVNACTGFSATAIGSKGTRTTLKRAPGQCPALGADRLEV